MAWFILIILFLFTRIALLGALPIFNDEATYLRWGWEMIHGIKPWWYSIVINGKPPLTMILYGLAQLIPVDPLLAGRFLAICFSACTLIFSLKTYAILFPKRSALFYGILLLFNPFLLFFDRLALSEVIITAFGSLILYAGLQYVQTKHITWIIVIACALGIGWWVKATIFVCIPALCLMGVWLGIKEKISWKKMMQDVIVGILLTLLLIYPGSFHPVFPVIDAGVAKWVFSFREIFQFPVSVWGNNMVHIAAWLFMFPTPIFIVFWIVGAFCLCKQPRYRNIFLFYSAWVGIPIILFLFFGKNLTARYFVIIMPQLTMLSALVFHTKLFQSFVILFFAGVSAIIIIAPQQYFQMISIVPRAYFDMAQYMTGWPSGYGVREAIGFVENEAQKKRLVLFVRNDTGNPEDAVFVYCRNNPRILIVPVITKEDIANTLLLVSKEIPFYFLSRGPALLDMKEELIELARFPKPDGAEYIGVYRLERK